MASSLGPWLAACTHILRQNPHFGRSAHSKFFVWEILNRIWIPNACTNSGSDQTPHRTLESRIPKSIHILVSDQTPSNGSVIRNLSATIYTKILSWRKKEKRNQKQYIREPLVGRAGFLPQARSGVPTPLPQRKAMLWSSSSSTPRN